jgi:threonine aldolase
MATLQSSASGSDSSALKGDLAKKPFALVVEVPHREVGGAVTSVEDLQAMRRLCDANGMKMHCDGARIFEALGGPLGAQV